MQISLESADRHAVQAYTNNKIQINSIVYENSLIVSSESIITDINIQDILDINDEFIDLLLRSKPEIIVIGHTNTGKLLPIQYLSKLSQLRIGVECMSLGSACRTYNVLLSEKRSVVAGFVI
ncbi:Mth938-like domain-containing protein [Legionella waltersii]|uniref:Uncharacterized protein n=1 Tax=Legionella waltersii TaxID=66969 RepID=A0A0W1AAU6_9GAMM|nr:MTH938/NDUFAF3 family protein [Legionella waltersii]KTD78463.1 hypothetical protein Lwal_1898 [Legionella waltersii]SNV05917.1 Protein of uncharacterised function (DUF498/DUF598) [Legionella waltersii]